MKQFTHARLLSDLTGFSNSEAWEQIWQKLIIIIFFGSTLYCNPLWNKFQSFVVYTLQPFHSLTDWQTWRPSILNVCTYLSSDGQLVSQGSVLRSWSIHPWPLVKDQPPTLILILILILIYPPFTNPQPQTVLEPPPETFPTAMSQFFSSVTVSKLPY